jgi:hypothetical protein
MKKPLHQLSQLQRLILVLLLEEGYAQLARPALRRHLKRLYWGERHALAKKELVAKSLSRALLRLEGRGYLERTRHGWALTCSEANFDNGWVMALNAWGQQKELYIKAGLKGPTLKSLGLSPEPAPEPKGVQVSLKF